MLAALPGSALEVARVWLWRRKAAERVGPGWRVPGAKMEIPRPSLFFWAVVASVRWFGSGFVNVSALRCALRFSIYVNCAGRNTESVFHQIEILWEFYNRKLGKQRKSQIINTINQQFHHANLSEQFHDAKQSSVEFGSLDELLSCHTYSIPQFSNYPDVYHVSFIGKFPDEDSGCGLVRVVTPDSSCLTVRPSIGSRHPVCAWHRLQRGNWPGHWIQVAWLFEILQRTRGIDRIFVNRFQWIGLWERLRINVLF